MSDILIKRVMVVLATIGFVIVNYLTYVHYFGLPLVCGSGHGCEIVQSSKYSMIAGVPVVLPGVIGYALILALLLWKKFNDEKGRLLLMATAGFGFLFSVYLTYIGLVVIGHSCIYCLSSAAIMTVLFILSGLRWVSTPNEGTVSGTQP